MLYSAYNWFYFGAIGWFDQNNAKYKHGQYRNLIPVSIYWSHSTIAVVFKLLDLYTVWNGQYTVISFIVKVILITKIVSGFKVTFNNHLYLFYC
jgi:hypothetical protein